MVVGFHVSSSLTSQFGGYDKQIVPKFVCYFIRLARFIEALRIFGFNETFIRFRGARRRLIAGIALM